MNQLEMEAKIREAFSDEEYVKSLLAMDTPEEAQASLAERGIDLSVEELRKLREILLRSENGELTDEELEKVPGGFGVIGTVLLAMGIVSGICFTGGGIVSLAVTRW